METLTNGTAVLDETVTIAPDATIAPDTDVSPLTPDATPDAATIVASVPDDHAVTMINVTEYNLSIYSPPFMPRKDDAGKIIRDANGAAVLSTDTYSRKAVQGMIARTLHALPEHRPVTVSWTMAGKPYTFAMRKDYTVPSPDKDARNMTVVFGVRQSDGSFKPWKLQVRNITGIAGKK